MADLTRALKNGIADYILPPRFDIVWGGCTFRSKYHATLYDETKEKTLLVMAPLVDDDIVDHSAPAHEAFLWNVPGVHHWTSCTKLPTRCANHRLKLAGVAYMESHEAILDKVQSRMHKLRGLNASESLR
ncbi:hypothetical protein PHMEG_00014538 [Phytophthora megakarya]|uniref:Uncharacterized protein n=1 Tax=Phytophthora megakarya TaxID=4795 RepID=A0A225W4L9_9STRA|nr:hypothetical protein PHMEG_00014538 [Phytophthora megakarya]